MHELSTQAGVPIPVLDGGCAQGASARRQCWNPRSTNLRTAATLLLVGKGSRPNSRIPAYVQNNSKPSGNGQHFRANQIQSQKARRNHQTRLGSLPAEGACSRWAAKPPQKDPRIPTENCCATEREQAPSPRSAYTLNPGMCCRLREQARFHKRLAAGSPL